MNVSLIQLTTVCVNLKPVICVASPPNLTHVNKQLTGKLVSKQVTGHFVSKQLALVFKMKSH